ARRTKAGSLLFARRNRKSRFDLRRPRDRLGRRPGGALLPSDSGLGASAAGNRRAYPRRVRGPERPPLSLARTLARRSRRADARRSLYAGHQGMGSRQSAEASGSAEREPELRVLSRIATRGRADRRARRAAYGAIQP